MIYDLGKKVVATAIINRPEVNSSTKTNGDPCRYMFSQEEECSVFFCHWLHSSPAASCWNEEVRTSFTSIEKEGTRMYTKQNYSRSGSSWCISSNQIQTSQHWKHCQGTGKMCMFHLLHTLSCTLSVTSYPCKLHMPFREQGKIVWLARRAQILASMSPV